MRPDAARRTAGRAGAVRRRVRTVGVLACLSVAACGLEREDGSAALTLESSTVTRGTLRSSVEATGTVEPIRVVEVRSQASGEILEMPVELGDVVSQGDLLLAIDPRNEVNALEQARADLERSEAELTVAASRLERMQILRDSGVVSTEELENALVSHANARSANVRARTQLELAQEQRADATVRAPISGIVIQKSVEQGQVVTGTRDLSGGTVLLVLADLANVQVRTLVDESDIGGVQPGLEASIMVEAYPNRTFTGEVHQVEPQATVEQNVTMFAVLTRIANEQNLLKPGMNADVEIVMGERSGVLKLSNSGVKVPEEARQLVNALGMDPSLLERRVAGDGVPGGARSGGGTSAGGMSAGGMSAGGSSGGEEAGGEEGSSPTLEELASMSPDERRARVQSLGPEERQRLMTRMGGPGGGGRGRLAPGSADGGFARGDVPEAVVRGRPGGGFQTRGSAAGGARSRRQERSGPRDAFVFLRSGDGRLTLHPIVVGLSSWEETEILDGLEEGDTVVNVPLALVQQSQMLDRFRSRMPGVGGGPVLVR